MKTDMEVHEITNLFPEMTPEEYRALLQDIQHNGLKMPIWTFKGQIIDGRHRYRACLELGIEPEFRVWDGEGPVGAFIFSLNFYRRHLNGSKRAFLALP